ncbi:MAG: TonB-dependent receptor domain-containing protein [Pseudoalteromonas sp.]|uniref:TonB-dependent receptor domain-containing protein n=1 Tax=unclassified Pseudoalteromonas TaxID=194690 RepID=UPI003F94648F
MLTKSTLGVAVSAALSFSVSAQQPIERITVSANKFEQSITDVLASVDVIERSDIEQTNVRDLPSLLATQVGFQINNNGGFGQNSGVSLRGSGSRHTLILIDGVRVGSATLGYKAISNIPLNSIERIEVIKGSRAAVYGSDALAGVINIITRQAENVILDATFGSDAYQNYQVAASTQVDGFSAGVNAGFEKTDGFDALQGVAPDEDSYENKNIGFNARFDAAALGVFKARGQYSEGYAQYDSAFSPADSTIEQNDFENYQALLGWAKSFNKQTHSVDVALSSDNSDNTYIAYTGNATTDTFDTKREQVDYNGQYLVSSTFNISGGVNWYKDNIETNPDCIETGSCYSKDSRKVLAGFLGGYYDNDALLANITVRHDDDEQFGSEVTYTAAAGYHLNDRATFRASQSTGFKAPTFNDLYFPGSGNASLQPEISKNQELGLAVNFTDVAVDVSIFRNDFENKIAWAPNDAGQWQPSNINEARHEGVEFSFEQHIWGFDHLFNFTYLTAEDTETGQSLVYVAPRTVNWSLAKQWQDFDTSLDMVYRSAREGKVTTLSSYTLWNLAANYQLTDELALSLRIENLLDKEYNAVDANTDFTTGRVNYYNTPDRRFFVGASYQF